MAYDVGKVASQIQAEILLPKTAPDGTRYLSHKPGPKELARLLRALRRLTSAIEDRARSLELRDPATWWRAVPAIGPLAGIATWVSPDPEPVTGEQWKSDLAAWRERLGVYEERVRTAPVGAAGWTWVGWPVTAPLLLGLYDGREACEFGSGTDACPQKPLDVATPFSLANQLEIAASFLDDLLARFYDDLKTGARDWGAIIVAGVLALVGFQAVRTYAALTE